MTLLRRRRGLLTAGGLLFLVSLSGALTSSGNVVRQGQRAFSSGLSSSGALIKSATSSLAGVLSSAGNLLAKLGFNRTVTGSLGTAGVLANVYRAARSFAGSLSTAGSLVRLAQRLFAGSLSSAGSLTRRISRAFAGVLSSAGAIVKSAAMLWSGVLTSAGSTELDLAVPAIGPAPSPTVVRQSSLSPGQSLDIRPGPGHEWEVSSVWASGQCALERVFGDAAVTVDSLASGSRWWRLDRERVRSDAYLRVRNTGTGTVIAGFSAVSLSEDWPA